MLFIRSFPGSEYMVKVQLRVRPVQGQGFTGVGSGFQESFFVSPLCFMRCRCIV